MMIIASYRRVGMPQGPAPPRAAAAAARACGRRPRWLHVGPRDLEIIRLAVPAFGALVAEPLFLLADSAIVGHLGTAQQAGLGIAGQALTTIVGLCIFLAYGTTSSVARQVGAGNPLRALRQGVDGVWLALAIGICL